MEELERDGAISIIEIRNRIRDGATATGYMDINIRLVFEDLVCEVQILVKSPYELKNLQMPIYERSAARLTWLGRCRP